MSRFDGAAVDETRWRAQVGGGCRSAMRKFIIYTHRYDEKVGGAIALHQLAMLLAAAGREVRLWPSGRPPARGREMLRALLWHMREWGRKTLLSGGFRRAPGARVALARSSEIDEAIVVYPEIVAGNPLHARRVVRWFLHRPGFHTGRIEFAPGELHFYYQEAFDYRFEGATSGGKLFLVKVFSDIYRNEHKPGRSGRCYILKKGADRAAGLDLGDGVVVDKLSHAEIARVFNQVEYCVSYDPYTFYSIYAAMCGCKSIIVPVEGVSKEQWQPVEELRYGLAYGEDDLEYARQTLPALLAVWSSKEDDNRLAVDGFVTKCDDFFR
jgi:hypothetical protein